MRAWIAVAWVAAALGGCADGPEVSRVGEHAHGHFYECPDGTRLDPGSFADHHQDDFDIASKCPVPGQSGRVGIEAPSTAVAYDQVLVQWDITPAGGHHTEGTELLASLAGDTEVVAKEGSGMVPRTFRATWMPLEPGTYVLQASALVEGQEINSPAVEVVVTEIPATGVVHDITIRAGGPVAVLEPADVWIQPGDTVRWINEDVVAQALVLDGPERSEATVAARDEHSMELYRLGSHGYTVENPSFSAAGTVTVEL